MAENNFASKITTILIFIIAITTLIYSIIQQNKNDSIIQQNSINKRIDTVVIKENAQQRISEYSEYQSLRTLDSVTILEDFPSYTPNNKLKKGYDKHLIVKYSGKIIKGYLEFKVSKGDGPLTRFESIYFKVLSPNESFKKYGGHIFRPQSLKVPSSDITHLLFALNYIPFLPDLPYSEFREPQFFDLLEIINNNDEIRIITFISSETKAKINSIKLFYESNPNYNNGKCVFELSDMLR